MKQRMAVLVADDSDIDREILCEVLREDFDTLEAENGFEAISKAIEADEKGVLAACIIDIAMPIIDGLAALEELQEMAARIPMLLITAESTPENIRRGHELGMADFIVKPFRGYGINQRIHNLVDQFNRKNKIAAAKAEKAREDDFSAEDFEEFSSALIEMLGAIIEYRGIESGQHIKRIKAYTKCLVECVAKNCKDYKLTDSDVKKISMASAVHDIGKIVIPDSILLKPGRLTPIEFETMKSHTTRGCDILKYLDKLKDKEFLQYCHEICRSHHERWDGNGYPDNLRGDVIPISAQVMSIADVYDALTTKNIYRPKFSHEQSVHMIVTGECGSFAPRLLRCFEYVKDDFKNIAEKYADA